MAEPIEYQMLVDLVGDHDQLVLVDHVGDELKLEVIEDLAGGVVRSVQHQRFGARRDRPSKFVGIKPVVRWVQCDWSNHSASHSHAGLIAVVHRLEHDHFVTGINQPE